MLKVLNARLHGVLDYLLALAFLFVPAMFELAYPAGVLAVWIGALYLAASLLTKYPLGALKLIPFPVHGVIEAAMAASWIAMPWVFGFAQDPAARNFYVIAGLGLLAVVALTDYRSTGATAYRGEERRHTFVDRRQRALAVRTNRRAGPPDRRRYGMA